MSLTEIVRKPIQYIWQNELDQIQRLKERKYALEGLKALERLEARYTALNAEGKIGNKMLKQYRRANDELCEVLSLYI
jgi:hypothetical protein